MTKQGRLAGKAALITAAGQGIGRATALAMAAEGLVKPHDIELTLSDANAKMVKKALAYAGDQGLDEDTAMMAHTAHPASIFYGESMVAWEQGGMGA